MNRSIVFCFLVFTGINKALSQVQLCNNGNTIESRIPPPRNAQRLSADSYALYSRSLRLQLPDKQVRKYDGNFKHGLHSIYCAVLDQEIGKNDLHQCADAIMRLRADFHYHRSEFDKIAFNFTNGHRVSYNKWKEGYRITVNGNKTKWVKKKDFDNSYLTYWKYLEQIFMFAGTFSLSNELGKVPMEQMQIGDVFIQGAFPGHAVLVVDMAFDTTTNKKYYLLGQSYMPAQQFQILINPNDQSISPLYELKEGEVFTPEWTFGPDQLKRFK